MERVWQGGLSGKARRVRNRSRAARLHAQQMIEEYAEPDPLAGHRDRYIPIRGRSEFLPSVAQASVPAARPDRRQMELPFTSAAKTNVTVRPATVVSPAPPCDTRPKADAVIRPPCTAGKVGALPFKPPEQFGHARRRKYTISGFLVGCAMGSAAAAVALFVVRIVIG